MDPASMNPEQRTSTPTKQDFLNDETQKLAMKTHLGNEEIIHRDLAERIKFVLPDLRVGDLLFNWQEDLAKFSKERKSGRCLKVEIIAVKGSMVCHQHCCLHFSGKCM